jgi:glucose-1-phosphate cytidylyltransferase
MQAVILAGGLGTRLSEETLIKPKPMVEIGGYPILWHIMKHFYSHGVSEFIICCGYRGYVIKEYFHNYNLHCSDVEISTADSKTKVLASRSESWKITLVDTGEATNTGGRLRRVRNFVNGDRFFFTYGDGVSNIDIPALEKFHLSHGRKATMSCVIPPGRFGAVDLDGAMITKIVEKPVDGGRINGGFFVLDSSVFSYLSGDECIWEREPLERLASDGELMGYSHDGFWHAMDTLRDKVFLEELLKTGNAPWVTWKETKK